RHDEDRRVFAAPPEAYVAMVVLTRLHLFTLKQVAGRDVKPARTRLSQLIAGDREAIHVAAACQRIPGMRQRRDGGNQRCNNQQRRERPLAAKLPPSRVMNSRRLTQSPRRRGRAASAALRDQAPSRSSN